MPTEYRRQLSATSGISAPTAHCAHSPLRRHVLSPENSFNVFRMHCSISAPANALNASAMRSQRNEVSCPLVRGVYALHFLITKCAARVLRGRKRMAPFMSTKPNARNDDLPPPVNGPEVSLWYHVLAGAFDDLHGSDRERADSGSWFQAETDGIGSFLWVCEVLGISASVIRRRLGFNLSLPRKTRFLPVLNHARHYP